MPKPGCGLESGIEKKRSFTCLRGHFVHPPISKPGCTPGGGGGGVLPGCMDINFFAAAIDSNCAVFKNNCIDLIIEMLWHCSESDSILLLKCCHFQSSGVGTTVAGAVLLFGANTR